MSLQSKKQSRFLGMYIFSAIFVMLFVLGMYYATDYGETQSAQLLAAADSYEEARDMCANDPNFDECLAAYGYQWTENGLEECTPESCPNIDDVGNSPDTQVRNPSRPNTEESGFLKGGIVKCGKDRDGDYVVRDDEQCHIEDVFKLFDDALRFVYLSLILPLAALSFLIAGWFLLTSGGDPGKLKKARTIITDTLIGIALVLCAWLIVHTIVKYISDDQAGKVFYVPLKQQSN